MEPYVYETIDRLCTATNALADIVRKQAEVIAQADIAEEVRKELEHMETDANNQLDVAEMGLRKIIR